MGSVVLSEFEKLSRIITKSNRIHWRSL